MGYTTFFSSELTFKSECPAIVLCNTIQAYDDQDTKAQEYVQTMFPSVPLEFWQVAHEVLALNNGDYQFRTFKLTQLPDGSHHLSSRSATRRRLFQDLQRVIQALEPQLVIPEGKILARSVGEDGIVETVLYGDSAPPRLRQSSGYVYDNQQGYVSDSDHPKNNEEGQESWMPPWDLKELQALNAQRKAEEDANWHPWM